jgi:transcriptional regulator with XRE-family HTH domain
MAKIDGTILKRLRESKGWTQEKLSENTKFGRHPKIDKRTISRLERDKQTNTRGRTVQQLARALRVEPAVLTGESPIPENKLQDQPASQSSVQISSHARNALYLIYERYHVRPWQVLEFAPFLLCWVAEASLRQRRDRLEELERIYQVARDREQQIEHMRISDFADLEEKVKVERESIESRDLFGHQLDDAGFALYRHEWTENPFARFLNSLAEDFNEVIEFGGFSSIDYPEYTVCSEEAEQLVGGDQKLAERILSGVVTLNEMPEEIRDSYDSADRAKWVRDKAADFISRIEYQMRSVRKEAST